jgi:alpha-ketoglutarate-dependent taurine dioxygenase
MDLRGIARRQAVTVNASALVRARTVEGILPLLFEPAAPPVDLVSWARANRGLLERELLAHGALLFRGFALADASDLDAFIRAVSEEPLEYTERSSPRHQVHGRIYSSTDYPPDQPIFFHNENSYQSAWPMKLFFLCETPAIEGGGTPLAANREIGAKIAAPIRQRFERDGVLYLRNYSERLGLSWQQVFQTADKTDVEGYCRTHDIATEWLAGDRLRTTHRGPAIVAHPRTREPLWFNHGAFFHVTTLPAPVRQRLLEELPVAELPQHTFYGDGSEIEASVMDEIRGAYQSSSSTFAWQRGDLLMLDNMLMAHAREPFTGVRRILVGMSEPHRHAGV